MNLHAIGIMFSNKFIPLLLTIIGFGLLVTVHELGHFIFCKIFGIHTPTFSIGMGPKLFERKIGQTNFRISALPIGGYVEIAGLAEVGGQGDQKHAKLKGDGSFADKPYWQKAAVLLGGVTFNLLLAYLIFFAVFFVGVPKKNVEFIVIDNIDEQIQKNFDLKPADKIISLNSIMLNNKNNKIQKVLVEQLIKPISENADQNINIGIDRNDKTIYIEINPSKTKDLNEKLLSSFDLKVTEVPGEYVRLSFFGAIKKGISETHYWIGEIINGIKYLITQKSLKAAGGPVMIISQTFKVAQEGLIPLFIFLAIFSINLAIINILPIGALDGGQVLFVTIEAIIRREIPEIIKLVINLASWVLLISLILYLSYKDILGLITGNR